MKKHQRIAPLLFAIAIAAGALYYWYVGSGPPRWIQAEVEAMKQMDRRLAEGDHSAIRGLVDRLRNRPFKGFLFQITEKRIPQAPKLGSEAIANWLEQHLDEFKFDPEQKIFRTPALPSDAPDNTTTAPSPTENTED